MIAQWTKVFIMGYDIHGRYCPIAQVSVPSRYDAKQRLSYVQKIEREKGMFPYANVTIDDIK